MSRISPLKITQSISLDVLARLLISALHLVVIPILNPDIIGQYLYHYGLVMSGAAILRLGTVNLAVQSDNNFILPLLICSLLAIPLVILFALTQSIVLESTIRVHAPLLAAILIRSFAMNFISSREYVGNFTHARLMRLLDTSTYVTIIIISIFLDYRSTSYLVANAFLISSIIVIGCLMTNETWTSISKISYNQCLSFIQNPIKVKIIISSFIGSVSSFLMTYFDKIYVNVQFTDTALTSYMYCTLFVSIYLLFVNVTSSISLFGYSFTRNSDTLKKKFLVFTLLTIPINTCVLLIIAPLIIMNFAKYGIVISAPTDILSILLLTAYLNGLSSLTQRGIIRNNLFHVSTAFELLISISFVAFILLIELQSLITLATTACVFTFISFIVKNHLYYKRSI